MTYLDILEDIGAMVNDPSLQTYKARAADHFIRAINTLIRSGNYTEADYAGYVKLKTDLSFSTNPYDASSLLIADISEIYPAPTSILPGQCIRKDPSEVAKLARNSELWPSYEELFYWKIGSKIYAKVDTVSVFTLASATFYMRYVSDIDNSGWVDGTNMQAEANYLSLSLIRDAIGLAVNTLKAETAGE